MDLDRLADLVGRDVFDRACRHALAHAEGCGTRRDERKEDDADELEQVPHELATHVEGDLDLAFALYRAMPGYGNLMYVGHWGIGPAFWPHLRALTDDPDPRQADPALYWLWCGPFEDNTDVSTAAWQEMLRDAGALRLRRLLGISGPVPWAAKAELLEALAQQQEWLAEVRAALAAADTDYFGRQDKAAARRIMAELDRRSRR